MDITTLSDILEKIMLSSSAKQVVISVNDPSGANLEYCDISSVSVGSVKGKSDGYVVINVAYKE